MAKKEVRGTREMNRQGSQNRGNESRGNTGTRSTGQSRQGSEWREMDRQSNGGRGMDTRHASGGRNIEEEDSNDLSRFYPDNEQRGGSRQSGARSGGRGQQGRQGGSRFPMDNLTYNVVTILHEKSKGLEAFDRYMQDARGDDVEDLLMEIREQDERAVEELQDHLHRLLMQGNRGRRVA
jgi:hypothetical protein